MIRLLACALVLLALPLTTGAARAESASESCVADHRAVQTRRQTGALLLAREAALRCADARCPRLVREDCAPWYIELEERLPSLIFEASDVHGHDLRDVRVSANGRVLSDHQSGRAVSVDPGSYRFLFEAQGYRPLERNVVVVEGVHGRTVLAVLEPLAAELPARAEAEPARRRTLTPAVVTLGAIATVGLTTFAALGINGKLMLNRLAQSHCRPDCSRSEVDHANRTYRAADVAVAVGGAAAVACAIVYLFGRSDHGRDGASGKRRETASLRSTGWDAEPLARGAALSVRAAF